MALFSKNATQMHILGALLIVASILGIIFIPWQSGNIVDKYSAMFARGEYEICIDGLSDYLQHNPDSHEARELLIQAAIATEQPLIALENLLCLWEAELASQHEQAVLDKIVNADHEILDQARSLLEEALTDQSQLDAARVFLVQLEASTDNAANALNHLMELGLKGSSFRDLEIAAAKTCLGAEHLDTIEQFFLETNNFWLQELKLVIALEQQDYYLVRDLLQLLAASGPPPQDLAQQAWFLALRKDLAHALEIAILLDNADWIERVLVMTETSSSFQLEQNLPELRKLLPEEPRLLALEAFNAGEPHNSMDLLLALEASGYIPKDLAYYGKNKLALIQQLDDIKPEHLEHIPEVYLLNQALSWRDEPERATVLADWLESNAPDLEWEVTLLRQILASRKQPNLIWSERIDILYTPDLSFSFNGNKLLVSDPQYKTVVVDLKSGEQMEFPTVTSLWHWQSNDLVITLGRGSRYPIVGQLDPRQTSSLYFRVPDNASIISAIGRLDDSTILLESTWQNNSKIGELDVRTGLCTWKEPRIGQPMLTSRAKVAWTWHENGFLYIDMGAGERNFAVGSAVPLEWYDNDRKLLLQSQGGVFSLDLESGDLSPSYLPPLYFPGNWASDTQVWGFFPFSKPQSDNFSYYALIKTDLITGMQEYAGLTLYASAITYSTQGNMVAVTRESDTSVYEIP